MVDDSMSDYDNDSPGFSWGIRFSTWVGLFLSLLMYDRNLYKGYIEMTMITKMMTNGMTMVVEWLCSLGSGSIKVFTNEGMDL